MNSKNKKYRTSPLTSFLITRLAPGQRGFFYRKGEDRFMTTYTGWINTDAVNLINCPKCKQPKGVMCQMPSGRKASIPHIERRLELLVIHPGAKDCFTKRIQSSRVDDLKNSVKNSR